MLPTAVVHASFKDAVCNRTQRDLVGFPGITLYIGTSIGRDFDLRMRRSPKNIV